MCLGWINRDACGNCFDLSQMNLGMLKEFLGKQRCYVNSPFGGTKDWRSKASECQDYKTSPDEQKAEEITGAQLKMTKLQGQVMVLSLQNQPHVRSYSVQQIQTNRNKNK